jgi:Rad3-related DNA helicase
MLEKYKTESQKSTGAVLYGVQKGRIFEGLDFKDDLARGVLVVGIPLPNEFDPVFIAKKSSLKERKINI